MNIVITLALLLAVISVANGAICENILLDKRDQSIQAAKNNLVGTIDIPDTLVIEFTATIGVLNSKADDWESVFHIGNYNAQRFPGIWFHSTAGNEGSSVDGFTLVYAISDPNNPTNDYANDDWAAAGPDKYKNKHSENSAAGGAFADGMVVNYKSIQTQGTLKIIENGVTIRDDANYGNHPTPTGIEVYVGDPWYEPADVVITNLVIKSQVECDCSAVDIDGYLTHCSDVFGDAEDDISDLRKDVDKNAENIGKNKGDITGNTEAIKKNAGDIGTNDAAIKKNAGDISKNAGDIGTNKGNIGTNDVAIKANAADIASLRTDIGSNEDDITKIKETLAKIADVDGDGQQAAPLFMLDVNHENYLLLASIMANIILGILAYCLYNAVKKNTYSKVRVYADSDDN